MKNAESLVRSNGCPLPSIGPPSPYERLGFEGESSDEYSTLPTSQSLEKDTMIIMDGPSLVETTYLHLQQSFTWRISEL